MLDSELKEYAKEHDVPISRDETIEFVVKEINKNNYKTVLEIGTAIGFGSITIANETKVEHIDTVEIDTDKYNIALENIKSRGLGTKITVLNQDAKDFLSNCKNKYDFIYLDGPKGQYVNYLPYLINLLNGGGMIIADNLFFHGMVTGSYLVSASCRSMIKGLHNFIDEIMSNSQLETIIYDIGDGICTIKSKIAQ